MKFSFVSILRVSTESIYVAYVSSCAYMTFARLCVCVCVCVCAYAFVLTLYHGLKSEKLQHNHGHPPTMDNHEC